MANRLRNWRPVGGLTNAEVARTFQTHIYTPPPKPGNVAPGALPPTEIPALTEAQYNPVKNFLEKVPVASGPNIHGAYTVAEAKARIPKKFTFSNENIAKSEAARAQREAAAKAAAATGAGAAMQEEKKRKSRRRRNRKNRKSRRYRR